MRVQLEGTNFLSLAQLEVFGHIGLSSGVSRVSYAVAGDRGTHNDDDEINNSND